MRKIFVVATIVALAIAVIFVTMRRSRTASQKTQAEPTQTQSAFASQEASVPSNPLRNVYFGELHLHTGYSFDAYIGGTVRVGPNEAYRFARGDAVTMDGQLVKRTTPPLDFAAVTDHAEWMSVPAEREISAPPAMQKFLSTWRSANGLDAFIQYGWPSRPKYPEDDPYLQAIVNSAWKNQIAAANSNYVPGKLTTFIAYEWTSAPIFPDGVGNLHRNVIFKGDSAPLPFTSIDSARPEDLWKYLENSRAKGSDALAIPHNANLSRGMMFDWVNSEGRPIDQSYAAQRAANEPLFEIVQQKGQSETRPELSPNDEFSDFEVMTSVFSKSPETKLKGFPADYVRSALGRGMRIAERAGGVNPYKYGFVGTSDSHSGQSDSGEPAAAKSSSLSFPMLSSPGLTGVWAERNTRGSIFTALRQKETFATSGTRLKLRFFGSWNFPDSLLQDENWIAEAYHDGVPMGGDLPAKPAEAQAPVFAIWGVKDPDGANLDRAQIVKVWAQHDRQQEKVYDVALSAGRKVDSSNGKAPAVGNTVDVKHATYSNSIGSTEVKAIWRDPAFDPSVPGVYYLRVIEIPTPRWSTILASQTGKPLPSGVPATIQERGWSSPIWYTPRSSAKQ